VLAFYDGAGRPSCATCTGNQPVYACGSCGREDSPFGRRCAPCVLAERAAALLADATGAVHPRLQPVYDALVAARRPQSVLYWFTRSPGPAVLGAMARGDVEISHAALDQIPANKARDYLRDLLVALEVLPPYNARLEAVAPWLAEMLATLPAHQADIVGRFAKWQVLRKLRHQAGAGVLTPAGIENGRAAIITTVRFLAWLEHGSQTLATASQGDLERYLVAYPGRAEVLIPFIVWANQAKITAGLATPKWQRGAPLVALSDTERWSHVELLLHDQSIRLYVRVAGLLTLLFAQPLTRICRMKASQISQDPGGPVTITFDTIAIELPDPLDQLVLQQLDRQGQASYASHPDHWLFPGGIPGRHLGTETVRSQLVERGIRPSHARKAAMFQLAGEIPTPVLAELLGLNNNTAVRWATLAARDWSQYTARRKASTSTQE
jgi:hypothetical protein